MGIRSRRMQGSLIEAGENKLTDITTSMTNERNTQKGQNTGKQER